MKYSLEKALLYYKGGEEEVQYQILKKNRSKYLFS